MNSLLSYFGLVDAKIRASDEDLPVKHGKRSKGYTGLDITLSKPERDLKHALINVQKF